ncbi:tRNA lysidine(34) synthetase TilS [Ancylobacter defluvii]|uniref:tRNA lysidine(34) synthetase TilS n=1 Tax=Ancylobacter defluvii TaxID=1282440 RepID=UPI0022F2523A|nr:tRNA lysidine(34) synthetase TilS [Ancylobacter defluvii]
MPAADSRSAGDFSPGAEWSVERLASLFACFLPHSTVLLAVSGGPDSTALMLLAGQWRSAIARGPILHVASVDHGLRPEAADEAVAVGRLAACVGLPHDVLHLDAPLAGGGLQEAARTGRYAVLAAHARAIGATAIATAHTLDDQAETVLFRLMRGSGLSGLAGMPAERPMHDVALLRPLLGLRKDDLIAACRRAGVDFVEDPSNRDPRFARARLRLLLPLLEKEGLGADRLARFAARVARADAALEVAVDEAAGRLLATTSPATFRLSRPAYLDLPDEIGLRLLGRAIRATGTEGAPELGKLEALHGWIRAGGTGARTLAGVLLRVTSKAIVVTLAPARRPAGKASDVNLHGGAKMVSVVHLGKDRGRT